MHDPASFGLAPPGRGVEDLHAVTIVSDDRAARCPIGAGLRITDLERFDNAALLARLREAEPVTWFAEQGVWLVTSKALVDAVHGAPDVFVVGVPDNPQRIVLGEMMLVADGDDHARHRAPFAPAFRLSAVRERYAAVIDEHVDRLLSQLQGRGAAELAEAFANPFAVRVAADVLGLSFERAEEVHDIYTDFARGLVGYRDPEAVARARDAAARLQRFLLEGVDRIQASPDASVLAAALHAGSSQLSEEDLFGNLRVILFGAIETVESMILNTTWALLHHPAQRDAVLNDPALWPAAVQEGLRWIPPVGYSDRWAACDTELGGVAIARGEYVLAIFHAANRDPAAFPDPDRFDVHRGDNRANLSFGKGIHMCLGVNLARLQGQVALRALFERLPGLRLDTDHPSEPEGFNFRRPAHLHVRWEV
jgi:cytochrome P450